jgi:hypothetical protein
MKQGSTATPAPGRRGSERSDPLRSNTGVLGNRRTSHSVSAPVMGALQSRSAQRSRRAAATCAHRT